MSTTIRRFYRPALNLITLSMIAAVLVFTGAQSASTGPAGPSNSDLTTSEADAADIKLVAQRQKRAVPRGERVVRVAAAQAGDPYRYGASGPDAFDCSGLTSYVYRVAAGKRLPRTSSAQRGATQRISAGAARRGDLVFFHDGGGIYHVAIYAGDHSVWHASRPGTPVQKSRIWTSSVSYGRVR